MNLLAEKDLNEFLEEKVRLYNHPRFIEPDPISIPHRFSRKEDIEIAGFLAATIAWGQRKTILKNASRLISLMDNAPFEFVCNFKTSDLRVFRGFVHRTFHGTDCIYFLRALQHIYLRKGGMETVFAKGFKKNDPDVRNSLSYFRSVFISLRHPERSGKHLPDPEKGSASKRLNMFLRWMVRKDNAGVDFGIWEKLSPASLVCPLDVHSGRVARKLGLLHRSQNDWQAAAELTENLRRMDPADPVKFDFALFGLGVFEKF